MRRLATFLSRFSALHSARRLAESKIQNPKSKIRSHRPLLLEPLEHRSLLATFTVTNTNDTGAGSLRDAIAAANSQPEDDIIDFSPGFTGIINLAGALPDISSNIEIHGPGADNLTIRRDTGGSYRVFTVLTGTTFELDGVTISNAVVGVYNSGTLTVANSTFEGNIGINHASLSPFGSFSDVVGSGIYNTQGGQATVRGSTFAGNVGSAIFNDSAITASTVTLSVSDSTFYDNDAIFGGAIYFNFFNTVGSIVDVDHCTFYHNSAQGLFFSAGGALNGANGGSVRVSNSTFYDNLAGYNQEEVNITGEGRGGAVSMSFNTVASFVNSTFTTNRSRNYAGAIFNFQAPLELTNCTVSGNSADLNEGGGFWSTGSTLKNTIVAGNTAPNSSYPDFVGGAQSGSSHNLIGDGTGSSFINGVNGDIVGTGASPIDPGLAPLGNYGGPTQTLALLSGSPALNAGDDDLIPSGVVTDQRGFAGRVGIVDIGAYEAQPVGTAGNDTIEVDPGSDPGTLKVTVTNTTTTVYDNLAGSVGIDGLGGDDDTYIVNFGATSPTGTVFITDTGTSGTDTLTVNGTDQDETLTKSAGTIKWRPSGETDYRQQVDFDGMEGGTLNAAAGNDTVLDPNTGNFVILGGPGDDTITIADTTGPMTVDGGEGSDSYIIHIENLQGSVTIDDTGITGTDSVTLLGTPDTDTITQEGSEVVANDETITLAGAESLTVDGGGGSGDSYTVVGTPTIPTTVAGVSDMVVVGTAGNDQIHFNPGNSPGQVVAKLNGAVVASFTPTGRIVAYGNDGDDEIQVAGGVTLPVWLYGDAGNDKLNAGNGGSLLFGGDGNDDLKGGNGRDVLIGGDGADKLNGNGNDDLLIAGSTTQDDRISDPDAHNAFWLAVLAEWNSPGLFGTRVGNLRVSLLPHVVDDLFDGEMDSLNGASGDDWLIFATGEDKVSGKAEDSN